MSRTQKIRMIRRRRIERNRRLASIFAMVILSVSVSILFHNFSAHAEKSEAYKYYTDIRVERGDTLWDIAMEYMTEEYSSPAAYIKEVKEINQLGSELKSGQYLVIPYYSEELK
ncbi:MAG: LysM peptidoglycan-binding domain-containing protein [Eubacteriales bacterium]|nr:LysM peptidoglycan-binding domain-containing protein [Eubacteriales bacterium]